MHSDLITRGIAPGDEGHARVSQLFEKGACLLAVLGFAAGCFAGQVAARVDIWVLRLLLLKPLVDLSWDWHFGEIFNQEVNLQTILALLGLFLTICFLFQSRAEFTRSGILLAFLGWAFVAVLITPTSWGVNELLRLYSGAAFFFSAGAALNSQDRFKGFARYFLLILLIPVCLSFLQVAGILSFSYWDWVDGQEVGRASGMYQTPLELVRFLVFGVPLALWLRDRSVPASGDRLLGTTFLLLSLPALFFTFHRAGWIVIGLEIVLWFAMTRKIRKTILIVAALLIFGSVFSDRVQTLYSPVTRIFQGEIDLGSEEFLRGRGALWAIFLNSLFSSHPVVWFTGKGGSIAEAVVPGLADGISNEPHNDFIRILHAYGIVGIILYFGVLWSFFATAHKLRQFVPGTFDHDVGTLLFIVLIAIVLLSITTEPMRYPTCVWYLFTLASVGYRKLREAESAMGLGAESITVPT